MKEGLRDGSGGSPDCQGTGTTGSEAFHAGGASGVRKRLVRLNRMRVGCRHTGEMLARPLRRLCSGLGPVRRRRETAPTTGSAITASTKGGGEARSVELAGSVASVPDRASGSGREAPGDTTISVRRRTGMALLAAALLGPAVPAAQSAEPDKRVAILDIELLKADYLPDAHRITPEERRRLDMVADLIRNRLDAEGYDTVPSAQTKAAILAADPGQYLHACNGCERRIARALGADWVAVGWVQFVSYLILNLNVLVIDVETGAPVASAFVDLRGSTDRSWRRATAYMLDHILVERLARRH